MVREWNIICFVNGQTNKSKDRKIHRHEYRRHTEDRSDLFFVNFISEDLFMTICFS